MLIISFKITLEIFVCIFLPVSVTIGPPVVGLMACDSGFLTLAEGLQNSQIYL